MSNNLNFNLNNYPKSFASIKKKDFRLNEYLNLSENDLNKLYLKLEKFCLERAKNSQGVKYFRGYPLIRVGWEWSVFKKNATTVIKIPSGIFPEVSDLLYLQNSQEAFEIVKRFYPKDFIPQTMYSRIGNLNQIEQEFIDGGINFIVNYDITDKNLLHNLIKFLQSSLQLVEQQEWLPDYWFSEKENGFFIRNVILENHTKLFKIVDFTQYFDPSRMFPQKTKRVIEGQIRRINQLLDWSINKLK